MPGLNFACDFTGSFCDKAKLHQSLLESQAFSADYQSQTLLESDAFILSCSRYPEYPVLSIENDDYHVVLEGRIYDRTGDELNKHLYGLASVALSDNDADRPKVSDWLINTDGDYIVVIFDKCTERIAVINDVFGRLPLNYSNSRDMFVFSRGMRYVAGMIEQRECDRLGIAEYLLFNHCLGQRTLVKDIQCLHPGSRIIVDPGNSTVTNEVVFSFNFETMSDQASTSGNNFDRIFELYTDGVGRRANVDGANVVSLSGGVDSRSVAAGLSYNKVPIVAASFVDAKGAKRNEVRVADEVANILGAKRQVVQLGVLTGRDMLTMLRNKSGMCPLSRGYLCEYLGRIRTEYGGGSTLFNGNGGDRVFGEIRPKQKIENISDMVEYEAHRRYLFTFEDVTELTGISKQEITDDLESVVSTWQESNWFWKFVHFYFYGGTFRRWNEGEDRNRIYNWATSPFWSLGFFKEVMSYPNRRKRKYRLYGRFLRKLSPGAAAVEYVNIGAPLGSKKYAMQQFYKRAKKWPNPVRFVYKLTKKALQSKQKDSPAVDAVTLPTYHHSETLINCMKSQINDSDALASCFSQQALESLINNSQLYNHEKMMTLFTVTSLVEDIVRGKSSLENYTDSDFGAPG